MVNVVNDKRGFESCRGFKRGDKMPLYHCLKCHHEWEGGKTTCDWCGADGHIIQEETDLEKYCRELKEHIQKGGTVDSFLFNKQVTKRL